MLEIRSNLLLSIIFEYQISNIMQFSRPVYHDIYFKLNVVEPS